MFQNNWQYNMLVLGISEYIKMRLYMYHLTSCLNSTYVSIDQYFCQGYKVHWPEIIFINYHGFCVQWRIVCDAVLQRDRESNDWRASYSFVIIIHNEHFIFLLFLTVLNRILWSGVVNTLSNITGSD